MKDLDFDELDRAVNSLMGGVTKNTDKQKPDEDVEKVLTINSSLTDGINPFEQESELSQHQQFDQDNDEQQESAVPASSQPHDDTQTTPQSLISSEPATPALATRRGGRFMDVVHPSSDMKRVQDMPPRVSRRGVTLEPTRTPQVTSDSKEEIVEKTGSTTLRKDVDGTFDDNVQDLIPAHASFIQGPTEDVESKDTWPDPLDATTDNSMPQTESAEQKETSFDTGDASDLDQELALLVNDSSHGRQDSDQSPPSSISPDQTPDTTLQTPFLAGTKVEKRPLGGAVVAEFSSSLREDIDDAEVQIPADPLDTGLPLPEELGHELMAIESDSHSSAAGEQRRVEARQPSVATSAPRQSVSAPNVTVPAINRHNVNKYQAVDDQDSGAIYDTATYHQPLTHPAKQSSGWLWVLGIIAIILLGVAGGAYLYFSGRI